MIRQPIATGALIAVFLPVGAQALWKTRSMRETESVPLDRLISNLERSAKAHPKDAQVEFVLGRLHSLAFAGETAVELPANRKKDEVPDFRASLPIRTHSTADGERTAAITAFDRALALDATLARAWLGKGWCLEQRAKDRGAAYAAFLQAFRLSANDDPGSTTPAHEAAIGIEMWAPEIDDAHRDRALEANARAYLKKNQPGPAPSVLPEHPMTPIVVALDGRPTLASRLDPRARTHFDLGATYQHETWPWVTAQAGLLAWDPDGCGHIRDGEQLFGSVTWWMFWRDGYQALAALDDDGDGVLAGEELKGLVIWIDRNGNGVSDPGEVVDVRQFGIDHLAASAEGLREGVPWSSIGAVIRDGRVLPTFDWTPESISEVSVARR